MEPFHGGMMCYFLGAVDGMPDYAESERPVWLWDIDALPDEPSVRHIAWMLRALYVACALDVTTYLDP